MLEHVVNHRSADRGSFSANEQRLRNLKRLIGTATHNARSALGESVCRCLMFHEQSRVGDYLKRADSMRQLAGETRYPEVRRRLLLMAAGLERLADQVELWGKEQLPAAAD